MQGDTILHHSLQDMGAQDTHTILHMVSVTSMVLRQLTMVLQTLMQALLGLHHHLNLASFPIHGLAES